MEKTLSRDMVAFKDETYAEFEGVGNYKLYGRINFKGFKTTSAERAETARIRASVAGRIATRVCTYRAGST
jgi:hypothetical protein